MCFFCFDGEEGARGVCFVFFYFVLCVLFLFWWRRGSQRCSSYFFLHGNTNMKHTKKKRGCKRCFFFTDLDMEIDNDKNCGRQEKAFAILAIN